MAFSLIYDNIKVITLKLSSLFWNFLCVLCASNRSSCVFQRFATFSDFRLLNVGPTL